MTAINLLPWRVKERERRNNIFFVIAGFCGAVTFASMYGVQHFFDSKVDSQEARNTFLQNQIGLMQSQLNEIQELDTKKEKLLERMNVVQMLQAQRPQAVHLFHEVAETLPDGIYLTSISQSQNRVSIEGQTDSNARVSNYMRSLNKSDWLTQPRLEEIEAQKDGMMSSFSLHIDQTSPSDDKGSQ